MSNIIEPENNADDSVEPETKNKKVRRFLSLIILGLSTFLAGCTISILAPLYSGSSHKLWSSLPCCLIAFEIRHSHWRECNEHCSLPPGEEEVWQRVRVLRHVHARDYDWIWNYNWTI